MKMKGKVFCGILLALMSLCLVMPLLANDALAAEPEEIAWEDVDSESSLSAALEKTGPVNIRLAGEVALTNALTIAPGQTVTMDLNGQTFMGDITVAADAALTVIDEKSPDGKVLGAVTVEGSLNVEGGVFVAAGQKAIGVDGGTAQINGGEITGVEVTDGTVTISDGEIIGVTGICHSVLVNDGATVNVTGGMITATGDDVHSAFVTGGEINISGGEMVSDAYTVCVIGGTTTIEGEAKIVCSKARPAVALAGDMVPAPVINIKDGTIVGEGNASESEGLVNAATGTLNISGGIINNGEDVNTLAVRVYGAEANITGGTIGNDKTAVGVLADGPCKVTIGDSANIIAETGVNIANGIVNITGGKIECSSVGVCVLGSSAEVAISDGEFAGQLRRDAGILVISGGSYTDERGTLKKFVLDGYIAARNGSEDPIKIGKKVSDLAKAFGGTETISDALWIDKIPRTDIKVPAGYRIKNMTGSAFTIIADDGSKNNVNDGEYYPADPGND